MANFVRNIYKIETIGFVAVYRAEAAVDIASMEVGSHRNLLAVHGSICDGSPNSTVHVFTYWRDEDSYLVGAAGLQEKLKLGDPIVRGLWGEPKLPRKPWWQVGSLKELLLTAAAVVGAYAVLDATLNKSWNWLAAAPAGIVVLSAPEKNVLAGTPASFALRWENGSSATLKATGYDFSLINQGAGIIPVHLEKGAIPDLAGSEKQELTLLAGSGKDVNLADGPVDFTLTGGVKGMSGFFRGETRFEPKYPPVVKIWPPMGCAPHPVFKLERKSGRMAELEGYIYSGDSLPNLFATVELSDPALQLTVQYGNEPLQTDRIPGYGWRAKFHQKDTKRYTSYPLTILISSPSAVVTDWRAIALNKVTVECE